MWYNMNMKKGNKYNFKLPDISELKHLYFAQKLSISKIANIYKVTNGAVKNKLNRHGLKLRGFSEAQEIEANHIKLKKSHIDFINGLLLGDGSLGFAPNKKSSFYSHTDKHKSYIFWLKKQFKSMGIPSRNYEEIRMGNKKHRYYHLVSMSYREFVILKQIWYPDNFKIVPPAILLKPITLFNWYIGDGHYNPPENGKLRGEQITIAMIFDLEGRKILSEKLNKLKIHNSIHKTCIYIMANSKKRFFNYMLKSKIDIPSCYRYKFPRRYCYVKESC